MKMIASKIRWKAIFIVVIIITIIGMTARFAFNRSRIALTYREGFQESSTTALVGRRNIERVLSSSGTIEPLSTYEVTTLVEGEVIAADFVEGDYVEKDQVLYQIATDDLDKRIETAKTNVTRAEKNYSKAKDKYDDTKGDYAEALADYHKAVADYGDANLLAEDSGIVKTVFVEEGDKLQNGSQVVEIYDNSSMLIEVPFDASQVDETHIGKTAEVTITDSFESLTGKVTKVSNIDEVLTGNRIVNRVTIEVKNPGGLSTESIASARIGDLYSSGEGNFQVKTQRILTAEKAGEVERLKIEEGSRIKAGDILLTLEKESVEELLEAYQQQKENAEDAVENAEDNMENAKDDIEDAKTSLEEIIDTRQDYSITAPIFGHIVSKKTLEGDTIAAKSMLCTIYDLSAATFEMYIDELDVMSVKVGQEVKVIADAFEEMVFQGEVINVSLLSSASGGVTQYPVTVRIDDRGDLLPGMNVTGEIVLDKVEDIIAVPSEALMRGDVVYVVDPTITEAVGDVPAGFREVSVETGLTDGDYIEIKSGLTGDEEVYVERINATEGMIMEFMPGANPNGNVTSFERSQRGSSNAQIRHYGGQ